MSIDNSLIKNMLKQSEILLQKTMLLSEDIKTKSGNDTRYKLIKCDDEEREKIINQIQQESEQIRKNSGMLLNLIIQIQDLNN